jgi:hypothetical protein
MKPASSFDICTSLCRVPDWRSPGCCAQTQIWGCSTDESNHIVHEFFKSKHFNEGIPVIPGKRRRSTRCLAAECKRDAWHGMQRRRQRALLALAMLAAADQGRQLHSAHTAADVKPQGHTAYMPSMPPPHPTPPHSHTPRTPWPPHMHAAPSQASSSPLHPLSCPPPQAHTRPCPGSAPTATWWWSPAGSTSSRT